MVAFMLDDTRVEACSATIDSGPVGRDAAIANAGKARHSALKSGYRQTALPAHLLRIPIRLDHGVDERRQTYGKIVRSACGPLLRDLENDHPERHMDLRGRQTGPANIGQGFSHIGQKLADCRRGRIRDRIGLAAQYWVPHAGDLQNGHGLNMREGQEAVKRRTLQNPDDMLCNRPHGLPFAARFAVTLDARSWLLVQVLVRDNNVDQALRALKKKMQREGLFREMKLRRNYEKPSERRAREKAEAVRRYRKLLRKRMEREGY